MTLTPDILWTSALVAIPVALAVAVLCRVFVRQPATRHALWVIALLSLVLPAIGAAAGAAGWQPMNWLLPKEPRAQARGDALPTPDSAEAPRAPPVVQPPAEAGASQGPNDREAATAAPVKDAAAAVRRVPPGPRKIAQPGSPATEARIAGSTPSARGRLAQPPRTRDVAPATILELQAVQTEGPAAAAISAAPRPQSVEPPATRRAESPLMAQGQAKGDERARESVTAGPAGAARPELALGAPLGAASGAPSAAPAAVVVAVLRAELTAELRARAAGLGARLVGARDAVAALPALPLPVWIGGSFVAIVLGLVRLRGQRDRWRRAQPAGPRLRAQVERAAAELGLRRAPACRMTDDRISPMICCAGRPRLLLPEALWRQLDGPSQRAVLLHELAHIRRRDHLSCWLQAVIGWVYWWHPVVWWVRGRIQEEADLCCDAWVVALMPAGRRAYAEALLSARSWVSAGTDRCAVGLPMATARSRRFSRRLTMVMTAPPRPRVSRAGATIAAAVALTGALLMPAVACPPEKKKDRASAATHVTSHKAHEAKEVPEPAEPAEEASTFERFMQERERGGDQPESGARGGKDEARLRQLEERLRRIEQRLSDFARDRGRDRDRDPDRDRDRESRRAPRTPETPAAPRTPAAPPAPPAPTAPPAPPSPAAAPSPHAAMTPHSEGHGLALRAPDAGKELRIRYYLPSGKLGEINDLMVRQDVPVLVSPGDEYIVVIGTPDTQQRFYSFVTLIHPEGVKAVDHQSGEAVEPARGGDDASQPHSAVHERGREVRERVQQEVREQLRRQQSQLRAHTAEARARLTELRSRARSMEAQHESAKCLSERARAEAADLQEQSQTLREKLTAAQKALSKATGSARDEAEQLVARLEAEAGSFQARAMEIARRAEQAARQSTAYAQQVENLESIASRVEEEMKAREVEVEQMIRQRLEKVENLIRQRDDRGADEGARRR